MREELVKKFVACKLELEVAQANLGDFYMSTVALGNYALVLAEYVHDLTKELQSIRDNQVVTVTSKEGENVR